MGEVEVLRLGPVAAWDGSPIGKVEVCLLGW